MKNFYYKYLSIERIDYLDDELLRFTQPSDLNDPFECLPQKPSDQDIKNMIDVVKTKLIQQAKSTEETKFYLDKVKGLEYDIENNIKGNLVDKMYYEAYDNINTEIGILSLSKNWYNTLMWSHYTKSHSGFCIGFNPEHSYFENYLSEDKNTSKTIDEVEYASERLKIQTDINQKPLELEPFFTKSMDWKYEEEIRMVATLDFADKIKKNKPNDIYLFKVPHNALTEIIAGANIDKKNEEKLKQFCLLKNIKFYKCKISETKFNMERA